MLLHVSVREICRLTSRTTRSTAPHCCVPDFVSELELETEQQVIDLESVMMTMTHGYAVVLDNRSPVQVQQFGRLTFENSVGLDEGTRALAFDVM